MLDLCYRYYCISVKNLKEVSLKGNLVDGECDGKCGMPDDNDVVIGLCVMVHTREQPSSQVPHIVAIQCSYCRINRIYTY